MKQSTNSKSLSILVVEDNLGDYILLKESIFLSNIPASQIELADSLSAAISALETSSPDLIFLDLFLPDSSGLASFESLKKYIRSSAVIVLSGISDTKTALEAIGNGAQDYLSKGEFDSKLLEKTITYALERRRSLESLELANERYRLVSKATNDLIWDWDLTTNNIYRDEDAVKMVYGHSSNGNLINIDNWMTRIHPDDAGGLTEALNNLLTSTDNNFFESEYRFMTENGQYKIIYDRGYVVRDSSGKPTRLIGAAKDVTARRKLEKQLQEAQLKQQRAITEATIKGQENEREQLGIELHDNITQILATSKLYLDYAFAGPEIKREIILQSKDLIVLATQELRKLSHSLLPPSLEEFGLTQALNELLNGISQTGLFVIEGNWTGFDERSLAKDQKLTTYRIIQEQLNNNVKHAKAKNVNILFGNCQESDSIRLSIVDDGKGFDTTTKRTGVGLRNITSRAELIGGTVTVISSPGNGCELTVTFPLNKETTNQ